MTTLAEEADAHAEAAEVDATGTATVALDAKEGSAETAMQLPVVMMTTGDAQTVAEDSAQGQKAEATLVLESTLQPSVQVAACQLFTRKAELTNTNKPRGGKTPSVDFSWDCRIAMQFCMLLTRPPWLNIFWQETITFPEPVEGNSVLDAYR